MGLNLISIEFILRIGIMSHIELNGWETNMTFSACHFIPGHEKCSRLHGHNYAIHFKAVGTPNDKGIIMDFVGLKSSLRDLIAPLDHKTIIPSKSASLELDKDEDRSQLNVNVKGGKFYSFPLEDVVLLDIKTSSAEELGEYFAEQVIASGILPENVDEIEIGVDEGRGQGARIGRKLR
jgi:6-pyruvoyltetrahydropterin/6-carboxytetrahydropterin synthase